MLTIFDIHRISKCTKFLVHMCDKVPYHDHASAMPCRVGYVLHMQLLKRIWEVLLFFLFHPCLDCDFLRLFGLTNLVDPQKHSVYILLTSCSLLEYGAYHHFERGMNLIS